MLSKKNIFFKGQHCETTATGCLLKHLGINLTEPLLFGIGEGLGYIYWDMKCMDFPFLGGRIKPDFITKNLCKNLNLKLDIKETSSIKKAWINIKNELDNNKPVGLKLDCYHLDYFTNKIHFAAHYTAMYKYDGKFAYLIDTEQQGSSVKTSLKNLELARNERGSMSSKNLSYTITGKNTKPNLKSIIIHAIRNNAQDYLNPPIKNIGYKGISKTGKLITSWFNRAKNIKQDLCLAATLMEKAGTGGALFRNLYRDFLKESYKITGNKKINNAYNSFIEIAKLWNKVSNHISQAGLTQDIKYLKQASEILFCLAEKEKSAMELLVAH